MDKVKVLTIVKELRVIAALIAHKQFEEIIKHYGTKSIALMTQELELELTKED